ncbi:MAG: site-2 protease family protein [Cyclobacteriaceae bacterium]|nr:site-2 protease family protein [Cyclobacteriaceae bacterium]MBX2955858.1 site-2 protease family protein [Cyclobacteriaceae bacterium]
MKMKYSLSLGRVAGVQIFIHWTFLILIGWIVYINLKQGMGTVDIIWSVLFILTLFACVTAHELGHALAAKRYHIKTRNITLLPIGGLAQLESIPEKPKEELVVALAGPLVNIIIAVALFPLIKISPYAIEEMDLTRLSHHNFLFSLMVVNIWLAVFNMIPAFPMDGGRVFRALLSFKFERNVATRIAASVGQLLAVGFVFIGFFYNPFLIFIGVFIFLGAQAEAQFAEAKSLLKGYTVADASMRDIPIVKPDDTIEYCSDRLLASQNKNFIVADDSGVVGTLNRDEIIKALREGKFTSPVSEAMNRDFISLDTNASLEEAWTTMQTTRKTAAPVFSAGQLVGMIDTENVAEFLMISEAKNKE